MNAGALALTAWRRGKKLRQTAVAKLLGVSQGRVSDWEMGHTVPSLPQRDAIQALSGVQPGAWLESASWPVPEGAIEVVRKHRGRIAIAACRGGEVRTCRVDLPRKPHADALEAFVEALFRL